MSTNTYTVANKTASTATFTDSNGNFVNIPQGFTGNVSLTDSEYASAVAAFGATNVTLYATASGSRVTMVDGTSGNSALIAAFHNADNQVFSGTNYGIFTGGVDQLINASGNLDRKRGAYGDTMAITGVAAEAEMVWNGTSFDRARAAPGTLGVIATSSDGVKNTYRYSVSAITPVATPTDVVLIQGSATKTVRIKYIKLSGYATTAGIMPVSLIRRLGTGGTKGSATYSVVTAGLNDTSNAAATAVVEYVQTANVTTVQTANGVVGAGRLGFPSATVALQGVLQWDFTIRNDQALVLRGTGDFIAINFGGAAVPTAGVIDIELECEEDAS